MRKKNAAVVQRLVPMLAMHMMTVRFRSVAPYELLKAVKPFLFYIIYYSLINAIYAFTIFKGS